MRLRNSLPFFVLGLSPVLASAQQLYDFENVNGCPGGTAYGSCVTAADGWTPFVLNANNAIIRIMNRIGTLTLPPGTNCNGTNWYPNSVNPESWELSEQTVANPNNTRYIAFQIWSAGEGVDLGLTREIPLIELGNITYHVGGRRLNGTNGIMSPSILIKPWVSTDNFSGTPCSMYPGITWTPTTPSVAYSVAAASSNVTWQQRDAAMSGYADRIWIRINTEELAPSTIYKIYIDDITLTTADGLIIQADELFEREEAGLTKSLDAEQAVPAMLLLPNPAGERTMLVHGVCDPAVSTIQVLNATGAEVLHMKPLASGATELGTAALAPGSYIVRFNSGSGTLHVLKLMKE